jgi:hypothetical protein
VQVIFLAKSLPLPNTSRTICVISSAWWSSLAKINVFGIADRQIVARLDLAPALADLGTDAEDFEADIDAIYHRTLIGILGDEVLAEEAERVERGRSGEANSESVKILQNLTPSAIDRTVAFVSLRCGPETTTWCKLPRRPACGGSH